MQSLASTSCCNGQLATQVARPTQHRGACKAAVRRSGSPVLHDASQQLSDVRQESCTTGGIAAAQQRLLTGLAVGLSAALVWLPIAHAEEPVLPHTLANYARADFSSVDVDKDGIVTLAELQTTLPQLGSKPMPDDEWSYVHSIYDLNMDGQLQAEEVLSAVALDTAVAPASTSRALFQYADTDSDQFVSGKELAGLFGEGDVLGPRGRQLLDAVSLKVDKQSDGNALLDEYEFSEAMTRIKGVVLD